MRERNRGARRKMKKPRGEWTEIDIKEARSVPSGCTAAYSNNRYVVTIYENTLMSNSVTATRLMIQRWDNTPIPKHWSEMQRIKNELIGEDVCAIEYYPKQDKVIDDKNIYWLFVLNIDNLPTFLPLSNGVF